MKILHRIASGLLFLPLSIFFVLQAFFEAVFTALNSLHYKNFYSFEIPKELSKLVLDQNPYYANIAIRFLIVVFNPFFGFLQQIKQLKDYEF